MKKRRRLRSWVKVTLAVIIGGVVLGLVLSEGLSRLDEMYEKCDNAKGYTCSYYEARLYSIRGE